jgi:hypothetical protein
VFQGFDDKGEGKIGIYTSWYNEGAGEGANLTASRYFSGKIPASLTPGQRYPVSITFMNTGASTWTSAERYNLGSQSHQDNNIWQTSGRVPLTGCAT